MKQRLTTLENGLRIITVAVTDARSLTVNIMVGTGSRHEDFKTNGGVSHFLEHLLFKGSKKYPSVAAISEAVDAVGGYNNAYTDVDVTSFYIKVPMQHGELALDILCDMVKNPLFDQEELDRERGVVVEEMNVFRDDPARNVGTLAPGLIFPGHPLGNDIIGSEEVIKVIPRQVIVDYQERHYRPNNLVVAVAGAVDHDTVVRQVRDALGDMVPLEQPAVVAPLEGVSEQRTRVLAQETAQAHFTVSARAYADEDPDEPVARLVAAVLGRGSSSRLFMNVRERQGLAYHVSASTNAYTDAGFFEVYAGVTLDKTKQALDAVLHELARMRNELVPEVELAKTKQQLRGGMEMGLESNANIADRIGQELVLLGRVRGIDERIAEIMKVTTEDVQRVARKMLAPEGLRFAMIAPKPESTAEHFEKVIKEGVYL